ncbi:MAG: hypothetical protein QXT38_04480 [Candidatus Aenigmatarchaeota archaeon]
MGIESKILNREVPNKVMLILFVYKNGKIGNKFLGPITITKLLYPDNLLYAGSVIEVINELEKIGIIYSRREKIGGRKRRILFVNFRKFVDIFDKYYNLNLTEKEKDELTKFFSEVDWRILTEGAFEEMIRGKLDRNIIQMVGDTIRVTLDMISFFEIDVTKMDKLKIKTKIEEIFRDLEKIEFLGIYLDFLKKFLMLSNEIIKKLSKIPYSNIFVGRFISLFLSNISFIIETKKTVQELSTQTK